MWSLSHTICLRNISPLGKRSTKQIHKNNKHIGKKKDKTMEDKPFWCLKCNKAVDEVNVDGYGFGDRMLEGVMYRVKNMDGKPVLLGIISVNDEVIDPKDDAYMHKLNNDYLNKVCLKYCEDLDIAYCPTCSDEILVWGEI